MIGFLHDKSAATASKDTSQTREKLNDFSSELGAGITGSAHLVLSLVSARAGSESRLSRIACGKASGQSPPCQVVVYSTHALLASSEAATTSMRQRTSVIPDIDMKGPSTVSPSSSILRSLRTTLQSRCRTRICP